MSNHVLVLSGHLFPSGSCLQEWPRWSTQVPRQLDLISQDSPQLLHSWRTPILLWWSPSDLGSYWWTPSLRGIYYPRQFHLRQCHLRIFTQRYYTKVCKTSFFTTLHRPQCLKIPQNFAFEFLNFRYFPSIFVLLKLTFLVTLLQVFKNSLILTIFGIVEWDFFFDFQTLWCGLIWLRGWSQVIYRHSNVWRCMFCYTSC